MEPEDKSQSILSKANAEVGNGQISRQAVEWLLKQMIDIPKSWLIISTIFIILSTIQVNVGKENSFKFQVNNTTAVFLALTWLPSVLKIFALSGGAVKTPAGEITGSGTISMLRSLDPDSLGFLIEQTKLAEDVAPPQQQLELRQIRHAWQKAYASKVPLSETHELMERLAQRYKIIRNSAPSGAQRTFEMESIAGRMRALAPDVNFSVKEVKDLLQSKDEGKRLLGLSIVEWSRDAIYFDLVLNFITDSKTAFEQTVALRAVEKMLSSLDAQEKKDLEAALIEQRNYNPEEKRWIKPDSNRWIISDRILSALQT